MMTTKVDEKFLNVPPATIPTNIPSSNGSSNKLVTAEALSSYLRLPYSRGSSTNVSFCDLSQPSPH